MDTICFPMIPTIKVHRNAVLVKPLCCAYVMSLYCAPVLCPCIVPLYYAPILCPCIVSLCCARFALVVCPYCPCVAFVVCPCGLCVARLCAPVLPGCVPPCCPCVVPVLCQYCADVKQTNIPPIVLIRIHRLHDNIKVTTDQGT